MQSVTIVDYGLGNILSVARAFEHVGCNVNIATKGADLVRNERLIIPGVGAFPEAMKRLDHSGLKDAVLRLVDNEIPVLGICLGMQLLFTTGTEHGTTGGLNLLEGSVEQLNTQTDEGAQLRLPSVGWRKTYSLLQDSDISRHFNTVVQDNSYYYVHSFHALPIKQTDVVAWYDRGDKAVVSMVAHNNIIGVQFHPEKSGRIGLDFLRSFLELG